MKTLKLIYIGDNFYRESGTVMSSIYEENGDRSDWGKVQIALKGGQKVSIRPAEKDELDCYETKLINLKIKLNQTN